MTIVRLSSKGQIVLPREVRQALSLERGDELEVTLEDDRVVLTRVPDTDEHTWQRWRGRLAGTQALQQHVAEHGDEVDRERLS